ncbi:Pimeloyl-ACP methyl ester carboxylesterase [Actinokineospora alba]|uniref:Pimeloyl-ACP methyl ester carboxylesterase n=1 Tax=Actinokineospora alba TaxID=504798 RepID=A0A1H0PE72_9PSEU|nr:alpha/beta hydrolase [Actinokineospora alba]TDP65744.1 pimeloyl-ACP methyl ester carboxylesterase [Actinokineospora alba]SDI66083.1 Pimeloyl-ACP methyl ester carboxylesterase [Actinokineospora alba]SDP02906.1 Pimeloyl-ACP methyl ester carboxylesterase [Actinokineospora alba]
MIRRAYGSGDPVTLVVPGLGATAGEARIPASGLPGTRIVLTLPGHADAPDPRADYWTYPTLAKAIGQTEAPQAVGVSLGAAALAALVSTEPDRFDRLVLMFPAALSRPRTNAHLVEAMAAAVDAGDRAGLRDLLGVLPGAGSYLEDRADALMRLGPALHAVATQVPVPDPAALRNVRAEVLIIAAEDDPLHPLEVAHEAAEAFPNSRLEVLPSAYPLVTHRKELRALLTGFLGDQHQ